MIFSAHCICLIRKCSCANSPFGLRQAPAFTNQACAVCRKHHEFLQVGIIVYNSKRSFLNKLQLFNDKACIFHMVVTATVRAAALAYSIEACATGRAVDGSNGETGRFHVGGITSEGYVDTVAPTVYGAIMFTVIDPLGTKIQAQLTSLHVDIIDS